MTVYFIRPVDSMGPVKIGCSEGPNGRLNTLQTWSPVKLEVVATIPGDLKTEARFHALFIASHSHGEWFHWSGQLEMVIDLINAGRFDTDTLPEPTDLRRLTGDYVSNLTPRIAPRSPDSDLIDAIGPDTVRAALGLTSQRLHMWRTRGIPQIRRIAFAKLCAERGVSTPNDFFEKFHDEQNVAA